MVSAGSLNNKTPDKVYDLIETMAINNYERASNYARKGGGITMIDEVTFLKAQVAATQKQIAKMSVNAIQTSLQICELCAGYHATQECQVEALLPNLNKQIL